MLYLFEIYIIVVTLVFILALGVSLTLYLSAVSGVFITRLFHATRPHARKPLSSSRMRWLPKPVRYLFRVPENEVFDRQ